MESRSIGRDVLVNPGYTPNQAVVGYQDSGPLDANELVGIIPAWHTHLEEPTYKALAFWLGQQGFAVRRYDLSDHILSPSLEDTLASHKHTQDYVADDLEKIVESRGYRAVHLFGESIGVVSEALIADRLSAFTTATIVCGSSNLALSMWHGSRTVRVRQELQEQGVDARTIDEAWHDLAPKTHVKAFSGKPVRMIISLNDTIVPTVYQHEMATELVGAGSRLQVRYTRLGHYAAIGRFRLFPDWVPNVSRYR